MSSFDVPGFGQTPLGQPFVMEVPSDLHAIEKVVDQVIRHCEVCREDPTLLRLNLRVSLTEALSNAVLYGNGNDPSKRIRIELSVLDCEVWARVTDEGSGFDPSVLPDPTTPENLCRPCGRGVFLMRELMDEVKYNDEGNSVTLVLRMRSTTPRLEGGAQA